jgi:NitT/TauT family transport system ATP-binding protein
MSSFAEMFNNQNTIVEQPNNNNVNQTSIDGKFECESLDVLDFQHISKKFGDTIIFNDFNLTIKDFKDEGQFISFIGKSGCGKSTILNMLAGLTPKDNGKILLYGKEITEKDNIPMVFQKYSSLPWYNIIDNVALPKHMSGMSWKEARETAIEKLELVGLKEQAYKYPNQLSGGQQQRVAIARALNCDSKILILDEYASGLDIFTKMELQDLLLKLFYDRTIDRTFLMVTHDISEAVYLSNRIFVLGSNPCHVKQTIDIKFDEHRTHSIKETDLFKTYVNLVMSVLN